MDRNYLWVSPYNSASEAGLDTFPESVKIYDTTLRDGEQTIGVCFDAQDKVRIAKLLDNIGVKQIEAGMPIVSETDKQAVAEVVKAVKNAEVWTLCRCTRKDIDASFEAGVRNIICEIATSPHKIKAYGYTEENVLHKITDTLQYAKSKGMKTAFFAVDGTRAELGFLQKAYEAAVFEGGAGEVVLVDTLGVATPETMYYLTKKVRSWVPVPLAVHCHNDFGMGVACTIAAVRAGATTVHVTVNGLGEKTGNADLAEVVFALEGLYGVNTNIDLKGLLELSKTVEEITNVVMSPLKPVVGKTVFQRESGVTVTQLISYPPAVEGYAPELIGSQREILLSKKSGTGSIEYFLERMEISAGPEQVNEILRRVKELGIAKKGLVSQAEFNKIVSEVYLAG